MNAKVIATGFLAAAIVAAPVSSALARDHFRHHGYGYHHGPGPVLGLLGAVVVGAVTIVTAPIVILADAISRPRYERDRAYEGPRGDYYRPRRSYDEESSGYYGDESRGYNGEEPRENYREGYAEPRGNYAQSRGYAYGPPRGYDAPPRGYGPPQADYPPQGYAPPQSYARQGYAPPQGYAPSQDYAPPEGYRRAPPDDDGSPSDDYGPPPGE